MQQEEKPRIKAKEVLKQSVETANLELFNRFLNARPKPELLKAHEHIKIKKNGQYVPAKYLSIERVEQMLTQIFQDWYVEILNCGQLAQSIFCVVRLHYFHPIKQEWRFQDGVGAVDLQTKANAAASDLSQIVPGAVQKGLPSAKSYAIKNAAMHLGKLFGRDVNRDDYDYVSVYETNINPENNPDLQDGTKDKRLV
jgi:hypothetical protein